MSEKHVERGKMEGGLKKSRNQADYLKHGFKNKGQFRE